MEIHIEAVLRPARLLVYGLTPAGTALVRLGAAMGYRVTAVDPARPPESSRKPAFSPIPRRCR